MKDKKKLLWILVGLLVVILAGVGLFFVFNKDTKKDDEDSKTESKEVKKEEAEATATPLLYKVTKAGSDNVIYLFGSIHMADDRAYPMNDAIMEAYNSSDYLAVEFDTIAYTSDYQRQTEDLKLLMYQDGTKISDHISKEVYDAMVQYLKNNNMYTSIYDVYKPALFYSLVTQISGNKSGLDSNKGIDAYFLKNAHKNNKNILEVESSSFQYNLLASFSDRFYEVIIMSSIVGEKLETEALKNMYEGWLKGDAKVLEQSDTDELENIDLEGYEDIKSEVKRFNEEMITKRNASMLKTVEGYFNDGKKTFVVVGAAHVVGDNGIAKGMEKDGYKVEVIKY